jgi:hypothetical protein
MGERRRLSSRLRWRWIFPDRPDQRVAVIEERADGFHAIVDGRDVGTFTSEAAAKLFVKKLRADDEGGQPMTPASEATE